jgi:hypothetical protein
LPATGGRSFREDITNWESQRAAFQDWADEMLPGTYLDYHLGYAFGTDRSVPEHDQGDNGYPTITYTARGSPILPHVNLKGLSPKVTAALLEEFLGIAWSKPFQISVSSSLLTYHPVDSALPDGSTASIPWAALNKCSDGYIMPSCLPNDFNILKPTEMVPSDIYRLYEHIVKSQQSPDGIPFRFTFDEKILASLTPTSVNNPPQVLEASPAHSPSPPAFDDTQNHAHGDNDSEKKRQHDGSDDDEASPVAKKSKTR